ncbi:MAG: hypothetical protein ACRDQ0_23350, partial [Pseudonocardia sp.]
MTTTTGDPQPPSRPALTTLPVEQALTLLRSDHPAWQIEYQSGKTVPWIAIRERSVRWRGGHPVCEATTADELDLLIGEAISLEA